MTDTRLDAPDTRSRASPPWLKSLAASMLAGMRRMLAVRRDRRLLQALPDSLLKDIGVSRGNIDYIAVRGGRT
jgi:uncharacterized protein YjiS (DUF1127 family)